jgi:hypothetical protein
VLEDDSGAFTAVANKRTGMSWSDITTSEVEITGIVRHLNGETRLYPRSMNDVKQFALEEIPEQQETPIAVTSQPNLTPWFGGGMLLFTLTTLAYWYLRAKHSALVPQTI